MVFSIEPIASIILLTKNSEKTIGSCLRAVFEQEFQSFEVILIDSGSIDRTLDIVSRYPVVLEKIKPYDFNHGHTRNLGAEMATGEFLVFLSADAEPANNQWLTHLLAPFECKNVAAAYGRQLPRENANPVETAFLNLTYPARERSHTKNDAVRNTPQNTVLLSDVCSAIRREIWDKCKFNEEIVMSEDQDIARKILAMGYRIIYQANAKVYHSHEYTLTDVFRRYVDSGDAMRNINQVSCDPYQAAKYVVALALETVTFILKSDVKQKIFWLSYALLYNAAKIAGFICGMQTGSFSRFLIERLSLTRSLINGR